MLGQIIGAVASIGGAAIGSKSNADAANAANAMTYEGMKISTDAINKYIAALYEGLDIQQAALKSGYEASIAAYEKGSKEAQETLGAMRDEAEPGIRFLREVVANPQRLTPDQRYQLEEQRRVNAQNIRASGFAGSGRTAAALMGKVENDTVNAMLEKNRAAALAAAGDLAGMWDASSRQIAGLQSNEGAMKADAADKAGTRTAGMYGDYYDRLGNAYVNAGKSNAAAMERMGSNTANATTASGNLWGQAIGDIGAQIASANRQSSYGSRMAKYEQGAGLY